jgi:peptidase M28-like protein/PDZ domain-containing protein
MRILALLLALLGSGFLATDTGPVDEQLVKKGLESITPADTLKKVSWLASDKLEGRNAGYAGCRKAGDWIGEQFKAAGLKPIGDQGSYFQTFTFAARGQAPKPREPGQAGSGDARKKKKPRKSRSRKKGPEVAKPLYETPTSRNVVGLLEGTDPVLKDEVIIVGGHYDHVGREGQWNRMSRRGRPKGRDDIWNGADDNASGSAVVMTLAEAFRSANLRLPRSILFICFSAEEHGLFGSKWYCDHPLFPLDKTVAMLNLDMVGYKRKRSIEIGGVDHASDKVLRNAIEKSVGEVRGFRADIRPWASTGSSDHGPFIQHNIPAVFFFNGIHKDYHTIEDEVACVSGRRMADVAKVVFLTLVELSTTPKKPTFVKGPTAASGTGTLGIAVTGVLDAAACKKFRLARKQGGVRVGNVYPRSVAGDAGIMPGDAIIAVGRDRIKQRRETLSLKNALTKIKPGQKFTIQVARGTRKITLRAELPKGS